MSGRIIVVTMPDDSKWGVPVTIVVNHRIAYYAERNPTADESNPPDDEILDWAANNMDWSDVSAFAVKMKAGVVDFQDGWVNGPKEIK